jgi:cobalamin biosynthesis protein CbiD
MNELTEQQLNRKIQGLIDNHMSNKIEQMIAEQVEKAVNLRIKEFKSEILLKLKQLEGQIQETVDSKLNANNKQQIVASRKETEMEIAKAINSDIIPRFQNFAKYVNSKVVDDQEIVSDFRYKVMGQTRESGPMFGKNPSPNTQKITGPTKKIVNIRDSFAFTDDD